VADQDASAARALGTEHGIAFSGAATVLLGAPEVDAVIVATPAETHAEIVEAAAVAGKHILCEKPFDVRLGAIDRALAAAESAGVVLQIAFNRRFDRSFQRLQEEIAASRAGDVVTIHIVSRDPLLAGPPRLIDGMSALFFDTTVHDFDNLRYLTESEIETVHVLASPAIHRQDRIDTATMLVQMANGVVATIDNSQAAHGYDQRVEVFGRGGLLSLENQPEHTVWAADPAGSRAPGLPYFFAQRYAQSYIDQMRSFVETVNLGLPATPSGADGRAATVVALAAQLSVDEGRPVRVEEVG
jgi:myo-inositol 2-dehydrogenase/D-chiro-inositol 1-dehydrogenase